MIFKAFNQASKDLRDYIDEGKTIQVITHDDADGLSAGAILHKSILRENSTVQTRSVKQLDGNIIDELSKDGKDVLIFTDMGSGQIDEIGKHLLDRHSIIVLDHHQPKEFEGDDLKHVNPHKYGIDGAREISGAGMAYFFSKSLNKNNVDLAPMAVVGAIGDVQDSEGRLIGLNRQIIEDGINAKLLRMENDLRLWGRQTRPLYKAIEYTTEPFIPGLSGNESACVQFLSDIDIPIKHADKLTKLADLDNEQRQRLVTALILKMIEHGAKPKFAESIVGEVYTLLGEEKRTMVRDAKEYATLLNACGRRENYGVGIGVSLGERGELYKTALKLQEEHKKYLSSCYGWISNNLDRINDTGTFYWFHANDDIDENVIGTVTNMALNSKILKATKPIIAFVKTREGDIKVSSRATKELIDKGINLGKVMMYAAEKVGGDGGGHDIAAGARLEEGREGEFLKYAEEKLKEQVNESER